MQSKTFTLASLFTVGLSGAALAQPEGAGKADTTSEKTSRAAKAKAGAGKPINIQMMDAAGKPIGTATMTKTSSGVSFRFKLRNLEPGPHAVVLHETGDCQGPSFQSAGGQIGGAGGASMGDPSGAGGGAGGDQGGQGGQPGQGGQGGQPGQGGQGGQPGQPDQSGAGKTGGDQGAYPSVSLVLDDLNVDDKGNATGMATLPGTGMWDMLLSGDGSALVIYEGAEPTQDGSGRIACGVISHSPKK